ncbi:MAG: hypothetical protein IJN17_06045 [Clostridia bacterium]|nr:hypothetical protein [Clostridia bacterium]
MKNSVILPAALQLCVDDIGWFRGSDDRYAGKPSRTGMPRTHVAEDYIILNEIGKAIDQKIVAPLVIGEWDKDNILRSEVGATYEPETWNRRKIIDMSLAEKCFEALENSEYIEHCFHGLLHGNYDENGGQITELEYFYYKNPGDKLLSILPKDDIDRRFELYYKIYNSWGFKKKIRSFSSPTNVPRNLTSEDIVPLAEILEKYGMTYWLNRWKGMICHSEFIGNTFYLEKHKKFGIPWNAYDFDPEYLFNFYDEGDGEYGDVMSTHWPNFLRFNYQKNHECLEPWVKWFKKQAEIFGVMLSKDIAFCSNQHIYRTRSKLTFDKNILTIDVSEAVKFCKMKLEDEFYITIKNNLKPTALKGCKIELYETHNDFNNYKITRTEEVMNISLD